MANNPYYKRSCLTGRRGNIQWHHCWKYAGKQINEEWAIMPLMREEHVAESRDRSVHNCYKVKELVQYLSLKRATPDDLGKYPKVNWVLKMKLLEKYKNFKYERERYSVGYRTVFKFE